MQMHTIWSNEYDTIHAIEQDFLAEHPEYEAGEELKSAWSIAAEINDDYLCDERANLNIEVGNEIIMIADLGLWDGRHRGYKQICKTNIADCLTTTGMYGDTITWFVDDRGDLMCRDCHHDGTNLYTYRAWKDGISEKQKSNFFFKLLFGNATRKDITRYTRRIGDYIADVYGWKIRGRK